MPAPILLRCDGGGAYGVGHVMRQLALADELRARGRIPQFVGTLTDVDWLTSMLTDRGLSVLPVGPSVADLVDLAGRIDASAVVLDGYHLNANTGSSLRSAGIAVAAMVDYAFGSDQAADLYVDQNLGADPDLFLPAGRRPAGSVVLAGIDYAMFRDDVLALRRSEPRPPGTPPTVLAVFGGTDAYAAAPVVVPAVLGSGRPMVLTVVASSPQIADRLRALPVGPGQELHVVPPTPHVATLAAGSDLAISAAGSSVWEFLCLGTPTALVCVVDNQADGYRRATELAVAVGLGHLDTFNEPAAAVTTADLLDHPAALAALTLDGQRLVDGNGRARVVDALLGICSS